MPVLDPVTGLKYCTSKDCRETDPSAFGKDKSQKDGLNKYCRKCKRARSSEWDRNHPEQRKEHKERYHHTNLEQIKSNQAQYRKKTAEKVKEPVTGLHPCSNRSCGENDPAQFYRNKYRKDGLHPYCKKCDRERSVAYIKSHLDKHLKRTAEYRESHRETSKAAVAAWAKAHPEKVRAVGHRRRARLLSLPHQWTDKDWIKCKEHFNNRCAFCGRGSNELADFEMDHLIPLNDTRMEYGLKCPGTIPSNMVPACETCNKSKGNKDPFSWKKEGALWPLILGIFTNDPLRALFEKGTYLNAYNFSTTNP